MGGVLEQLRAMFASLSMGRKVSMLIVLVLAVGVVGYIIHMSRQASMEPLFTNLNAEDLGAIVTRLDKQNIQYQVDQNQRTVLAPANKVIELRLKLASEGLPHFGGVGFEIFDKSGLGMSEFEQRINFQRALEGELMRTISGIREVESARVHLVLPKKSLFSESSQSASASVIVKLGNVGSLSRSKVNAITHLVASAVEGLGAEEVTVVDTAGHLLTSANGDSAVAAGSQVFDQKMQIERSLEKRIVELLSPVVGLGKVIARVTAEIDFTSVKTTDELVDPTRSAVVSESRSSSNRTEGAAGAGGVAGAAANLPGGAGGAAGTGGSGSADESSENISYAISKTVEQRMKPMGSIKNLSVAVLVDGTYSIDEAGEEVYNARSAEDLTRFEELVKRAIGFSDPRGDQIKVENIQFQTPEEIVAESQEWYQQRTTYGFLITVISNVLVVLVAILVFFFVIRPIIRNWGGARAVGPDGTPLLEGQSVGDVGSLVRANPQLAADAIRQWIK